MPGASCFAVCATCERHYRCSEARCPFCESPSPLAGAVKVAVAVAVGAALAACYGRPHGYYPPPMPADASPAASDAEAFGPPAPSIGPPAPPPKRDR